MSKRTTLQAIEEAEVTLAKEVGDDEGYHGRFDDLLEQRLAELDPTFLEAMRGLYEDSGMGRWCA